MYADQKYLQLLSTKYPNRLEVAKEIVLAGSVLNLTKGTEIFLSDIHGEHEAFQHVLRNGSGVIKQKIKEIFANLYESEINQLATLIYYPEEKLPLVKAEIKETNTFYRRLLRQQIQLTRAFASIYSTKKFQKLLPQGFDQIISELVAER